VPVPTHGILPERAGGYTPVSLLRRDRQAEEAAHLMGLRSLDDLRVADGLTKLRLDDAAGDRSS
jgi:hypothetical protein